MADFPPTPRIAYAHTSYLLTMPPPAPAAPPPEGAALIQAWHWKQFLCGLALALLPSLISFGLGLVMGPGNFLTAASFAAWLGILYNPAFGLGAMMIGLLTTNVSRMVGFGLLAGFLLYFLLDCAIIQLLSMAGFIM